MDDAVCRVCQEEGEGKLISPCDCNGTQRFIHEECLNLWVQSSKNNTTCPTCRATYGDDFIITILEEEHEVIEDGCVVSVDIVLHEICVSIFQYVIILMCIGGILESFVKIYSIALFLIPFFVLFKAIEIIRRD